MFLNVPLMQEYHFLISDTILYNTFPLPLMSLEQHFLFSLLVFVTLQVVSTRVGASLCCGHYEKDPCVVILSIILCIFKLLSQTNLPWVWKASSPLCRHYACFRCHINKIHLIKGPNRILLTLEDVTIINPHFGSKVRSFYFSCCTIQYGIHKPQVTIEDLTCSQSELGCKNKIFTGFRRQYKTM